MTEITKDRAITRPETLYANNVCADLTLEYLTSLARPEEWRYKVHPSAFHDVTSMQRMFKYQDYWPPASDERGRCRGSWVPPMGIIGYAEVYHRAVDGVLRTIKNDNIPSVLLCSAKRF